MSCKRFRPRWLRFVYLWDGMHIAGAVVHKVPLSSYGEIKKLKLATPEEFAAGVEKFIADLNGLDYGYRYWVE